MHMAAELDAGDVILQAATPIHPEGGTRRRSMAALAELGGPFSGGGGPDRGRDRHRTPQDPNGVSFAPMLSKELSPVDWSRSAQEIHDQIRGLMPWPRASTDVLGGEAVKLYRSQVLEGKRPGPRARCWAEERTASMCCAEMARYFALQSFRRLAPRRMSAADYLRGHPLGN